MIDSLKIGSNYKIVLNPSLWPDVFFYVQVAGITNSTKMEDLSEYNLKEELFEKYEYGINTYLSNTDGDIYILQVITDLVTGSFEEKPMVLPINMIDFSLSDELISVYKVKFSLEGIVRRFLDLYDLDKYLKSAKLELKTHLQKLNNFYGENIAINSEESTYLTEEEPVLLEEKAREERFKSFIEAETQTKLEEEAYRRNMVYKVNESNRLIAEYTELKNEIVKDQEKANAFYNDTMLIYDTSLEFVDVLKKTVDLMNTFVLENDLDVEVPTWEDFYEEAKNNIPTKPETQLILSNDLLELNIGESSEITITTNALDIEYNLDNSNCVVEKLLDPLRLKITAENLGSTNITVSATANGMSTTTKSINISILNNTES